MKAEIGSTGIIRIIAENETEEFALDAAISRRDPRVVINKTYFNIALSKEPPLSIKDAAAPVVGKVAAQVLKPAAQQAEPMPPAAETDKPEAQRVAVAGFSGLKIMDSGSNIAADLQARMLKLADHPHFQDFASRQAGIDLSTVPDSRGFAISWMLSKCKAIRSGDGYKIEQSEFQKMSDEFVDFALKKYNEHPFQQQA